ncbi:glycoside hydrolase [Devosia sp. 2618]|uniref:glycoside hydrolase n=1 Tax=Devosia sp. 2618 TaxID=3156454 RepID=UPI003396DF2A
MRSVLALALVLLGTAGAWAQDWAPVREINLEVAPGSPLDFSTILPNGVINDSRHLVISEGRFAMSDTPDQPEPLMCASLGWSPASGGFPDHADADRYARQLAMHGYNIARFHFVEAALMADRDTDFDFNPEILDRVHYLMAALKREGISWIMDGVTSARGGDGGFDDRWDSVGPLKQSILLEPDGIVHWTRLQQMILGADNPYTGIAPIRDPALALIVLVNEGSLEFDSIIGENHGDGTYSPLLLKRFNEWLARRYANTAALAEAWGGLPPGQSLEAGTITLPTYRYDAWAGNRDLQLFEIETETIGTANMTAILRSMGYQGAISNYNNWPTLQGSISRRDLDTVTMNVYFDWVSGYNAGARIEQKSSIGDGLSYIRVAAATRWLDKPFLITEYDHLFWNKYRYEAGLAFPAYAAFQGWDGICRHAHGPIALRYGEDFPHKKSMLPYAIALDPVGRAGETLAALLFRRGDVAKSGLTIPFRIDGDKGLNDYVATQEPEGPTGLMALGAIGLAPGSVGGVPADRSSTSFGDVLEQLVRGGAVDRATANEVAQGAFNTDTGEIGVFPDKRLMQVVTAKTVAAAFDTLDGALTLGSATLRSSSTPGLFALSALDDADLADSKRVLVIFATDARNSGMRFADAEAKEIVDFGQLPVLIEPGTVNFTLAGEGRWTIAPVGLDGVVGTVVASGTGPVDLSLSNVTPNGPTTYFVIERD